MCNKFIDIILQNYGFDAIHNLCLERLDVASLVFISPCGSLPSSLDGKIMFLKNNFKIISCECQERSSKKLNF